MFTFFKKKISESQIIQNTDFVVVDTELTGLDEKKDSIVSIGAIRMRGKTIFLGDVFYRHLRPLSELKKDSILIHQITPSELEKYPDIKSILGEFLSFCKQKILVGHFIRVDLIFLKKEIKRYLGIDFNQPAVDIYLVFRWLCEKELIHKEFAEASSLPEIAEALKVESKDLHDSLSDAFSVAQIFQKQIALLQSLNMFKLDFLLKIGKPDLSKYILQKQKVYQF